MKVTILDGYIDEPSRLGVPPYVSPYSRYCFGAVSEAGHEPEYMTIDHYRKGQRPGGQVILVISGPVVPGRYLRTMPMSPKELSAILQGQGEFHVWHSSRPETMPPGGNHVWGCDPDVFIHTLLQGSPEKRRRTPDEWAIWAQKGAAAITAHHDPPDALMAEIDMSYGCPHYVTGGCSFCTEPFYGEPVFRSQKSIINEMEQLLRSGCGNFRLGGGSCIMSYKAKGIGEAPVPMPDTGELGKLLSGISGLEGIRVLHTDNADPSVISNHPVESAKILGMLVKACTPGNSLSLGLESADPLVAEANNLNTTADQTLDAIRMINKAGSAKGSTGLPLLLPGLNFLSGLRGETGETNILNQQFLEGIYAEGLLLRRINIRQVSPTRQEFPKTGNRKSFIRFKEWVREHIDRPMLERMIPAGTLLTNVYTEIKVGKIMFARQLGTYPILVGLPGNLEQGKFLNAKVVSHGSRSITALEHPLDINNCGISCLEHLPGIGKKRAARIFTARPIRNTQELEDALDEPALVEGIMGFVSF